MNRTGPSSALEWGIQMFSLWHEVCRLFCRKQSLFFFSFSLYVYSSSVAHLPEGTNRKLPTLRDTVLCCTATQAINIFHPGEWTVTREVRKSDIHLLQKE